MVALGLLVNPPGAPTQLLSDEVTAERIVVSWTAPLLNAGVSLTEYIIYWSSVGGVERSTRVAASVQSYAIKNLAARTNYQITIEAANRAGRGASSTPLEVRTEAAPTRAQQSIAAGSAHSCAVSNGAAKCWGKGNSGQLGNGRREDSPVAVEVTGLEFGVTAVAAGADHSCAIHQGLAKCWGSDSSGQLGNGNSGAGSVAVSVQGLTVGVTTIATGDFHSCAIDTAGAAKCWGGGGSGQLGNNGSTDSHTVVNVEGLSEGVRAIAAGTNHSCTIDVAGAAKCWGAGDSGQLGAANNRSTNTAIAVQGLTAGVTGIAAGDSHSCAIHNGMAKCWGAGDSGQLGAANNRSTNTAIAVQGLSIGVRAIAAGANHSCAIDAAGAAKCWGAGDSGQLGNNLSTNSHTAVAVEGLVSGVIEIAAGNSHSCAIHNGIARCWGANTSGQLGNGNTELTRTLIDVPNLPQVGLVPSPPPPIPLKPRSGLVTTKSIVVHWDALDDEDIAPIIAYVVYWGTDQLSASSRRVNIPATMTLLEDLAANSAYQIAVSAVNRGDEGKQSAILVEQTLSSTPLASPARPTATTMGTSSLTISWGAPANVPSDAPVTGYLVYWGIKGMTVGSNRVGVLGSYTIEGLDAATSYQITVAAINRNGRGRSSPPLEFTTPVGPPAAPTQLRLQAIIAAVSD